MLWRRGFEVQAPPSVGRSLLLAEQGVEEQGTKKHSAPKKCSAHPVMSRKKTVQALTQAGGRGHPSLLAVERSV